MSDFDTSPRTFPSNLINYIWNSGSACIAIASVTYSIAASLVRPLSPGIGVFQIVSVRSALSLLFSQAAYSLSGQTSPLFGERQHMPFLAMRGLIGAMAMDCYYASIQRLPLADAVSLLFLNPVLTAVLAWLLLKERLTWKALLGSFISLAGMFFVVRPPFLFGGPDGGGGGDGLGLTDIFNGVASINTAGWGLRRLWGVIFGLSSAFLAAGAYLTIRVIGKKASAISIAVWFHTAALTHAFILLILGWPRPAVWPTLLDWICLFAIAVSSFCANILLNRGFQIESAAVGSAVNTSQVIYSHIIGIMVLHEDVSWVGALGAGMITVGVLLVAVEKKQHTPVNTGQVAASEGAGVINGSTIRKKGRHVGRDDARLEIVALTENNGHTDDIFDDRIINERSGLLLQQNGSGAGGRGNF